MKLGETAKGQDRYWAELEKGEVGKGKKNGQNGKDLGEMEMGEMGLGKLGINPFSVWCPFHQFGIRNGMA